MYLRKPQCLCGFQKISTTTKLICKDFFSCSPNLCNSLNIRDFIKVQPTTKPIMCFLVNLFNIINIYLVNIYVRNREYSLWENPLLDSPRATFSFPPQNEKNPCASKRRGKFFYDPKLSGWAHVRITFIVYNSDF